ncbi:hypothetical protein Pyrfu_0040 [Pyrolobus fumarii 1A]|uniref:Phosphoesterase DHHA1 n=1 Tax=Pyrolobus fumarii (strain DSM 11204 / 1A) TaxID=694429 RepID=G0EDZ6_PYRF1|nr:hypothetical protein [Pyrolobus fumarii]AEM37912.1 hypothetical protein Pyrfu_0040 [Pyrolobus fumarii 1A]
MRTSLEKVRRLYIVFHGDLDGVVGAALLARWASDRGARWEAHHSTVRGLPRVLRNVVNKAKSMLGKPGIALVDLAVQSMGDAIIYANLLKGMPSAWFDHHPWPSGAAERLLNVGVEVYHLRDYVSAELVARTLGLNDEYSAKLVRIARADDTCEPGESEADKWRIVLRALRDPVKAVEAFARGDLWPDWAQQLYEEHVERYMSEAERVAARLRVYEYNGVKVAVIPMEPGVDVCTIQKLLWSRGWNPENIDVEVYVYPRAISLRSVKLDVSCIAKALGGGGHKRAAGAPRPSQLMGEAQIARLVASQVEKCLGEATH